MPCSPSGLQFRHLRLARRRRQAVKGSTAMAAVISGSQLDYICRPQNRELTALIVTPRDTAQLGR